MADNDGPTAASSAPSQHLYHHHHHITRHRIPSSGEEHEEEELDPRIQIELERLNKASEEINKLELELDDARAGFRQVLSDSTQCLNGLAKKLGACVDKARPYYDGRMRLKEAHVESQKAAIRFERACSMHEAAKEMVQLAEEGYKRREEDLDPTWQEMLNHATMKVNDAEKERIESEAHHQQTTISFKKREEDVQKLQKDLKRSITKSRPYFEMKAKFNQVMEDQKSSVSRLEESVVQAKGLYSTALRNLEAISDDIHRARLERRQKRELGERGAGVGSEAPSPPPSWDKGINIEGSPSSCAFDSDADEDCGKSPARPSLPASMETDPLNVAVFNTSGLTSHLPSVIRPQAEKARSHSYRTAVGENRQESRSRGRQGGEESSHQQQRGGSAGESSQEVTPTLEETAGGFQTLVSSPVSPGGNHNRHHGPGSHSPSRDLNRSLSPSGGRESSLSRAQEWVNRSPVPHQRRFVKSQSLIYGVAPAASSLSHPSSSGSPSSSPRDGAGKEEEEGSGLSYGSDQHHHYQQQQQQQHHQQQPGLSSSLTTAAMRAMRTEHHHYHHHQQQQPSGGSTTLPPQADASTSSPPAPPTAPHQFKSTSLGSVRSLGSTPPTSGDYLSSSPTNQRRSSPKLQGLILCVDPSGGNSGSGSSSGSGSRSAVSQQQQQHHHPPHGVNISTPKVIISTQHPTVGLFPSSNTREECGEIQPDTEHTQSSTLAGGNDAAMSLAHHPSSSLSSSTTPSTAFAGSATSPQIASSLSSSEPRHQQPLLYPSPSSIPSRQPTSAITSQLNKMMQAVGGAVSDRLPPSGNNNNNNTTPTRVSAYNSKTAPPSTLMGTSYRLPSSPAPPQHQNPPTPLSPGEKFGGPSMLSGVGGHSSTSGSLHALSIHLKPPSDSSDTESIASTGPMLDDDQVELINMDFTEQSISQSNTDADPYYYNNDDGDYSPVDPLTLGHPRGHWSRMSLPPRLNYLEAFLDRAGRRDDDGVAGVGGDKDDVAVGCDKDDVAIVGGDKDDVAGVGGDKDVVAGVGGDKDDVAGVGGDKDDVAGVGGDKDDDVVVATEDGTGTQDAEVAVVCDKDGVADVAANNGDNDVAVDGEHGTHTTQSAGVVVADGGKDEDNSAGGKESNAVAVGETDGKNGESSVADVIGVEGQENVNCGKEGDSIAAPTIVVEEEEDVCVDAMEDVDCGKDVESVAVDATGVEEEGDVNCSKGVVGVEEEKVCTDAVEDVDRGKDMCADVDAAATVVISPDQSLTVEVKDEEDEDGGLVTKEDHYL